MKNLAGIPISLLLGLHAFAQTNTGNFIVTTDPQGHSSNVKAIKFSHDGEKVISASDDKTIRIWDVKSGVLVNTLRGDMDESNYGMLNSAALWPNKPVVAVGGYLGRDGEKLGRVRFFSYETGEQLSYVSGPQGSLVSMDFAPNEKFMAAGSTNGEIGIWNLETFQSISLSGHTEGVYGLAFSPDSKKMVTGSYDGKAILWDLEVLYNPEKEIGYKVLTDHTAQVRAVAFSPTGEYFATGGYDNRVLLYNGTTGEFIKEVVKIIDAEYEENHGFGDVHALAFSDDGKKLVIGTSLSNKENVWVMDVGTGKKITGFTGHDNTVMALDIYGNNKVVSVGGENREIFVWDANTGKVLQSFKGHGQRVFAVGVDDQMRIVYGQQGYAGFDRTFNHFGAADKYFDLNTFTVGTINSSVFSDYKSEITTYNGASLGATSVSELTLIAAEGEEIAIKLDPGTDGDLRCFTFTPDGKIAVGTSYRIILFDHNGNRLRELNGHTAEIYSLSSKDKWLISGSADQSIRLWDLTDEGEYPMTRETFKKYLEGLGVTEEKLQQFLQERSLTFDQLYLQYNQKNVKPAFTYFPVGDDWILYSKENYYATSKNGSRYVGFHFNQGIDKTAGYYNFRQFDYQLNRPDKIVEKLFPGNAKLQEALSLAVDKRIKRSGYVVPLDNQLAEAPKLELKNIPTVVTDPKIKLSFNLSGTNLKKLNITVNGVPVDVSGADLTALFREDTYNVMIYSCNFTLVNGKNEIDLWVTNKTGISSNVRSFTVYCNPKETDKPDLYVVTLGVSKYLQNDFNLLYAAKDAADVSALLTASKNEYNKVHQLSLVNEQVKLSELDQVRKFLSASKLNDKVVVFYAGHGMFDAQFNYYLATHDIDFNHPAQKGIAYEKFEALLAGIPARNKLVLIDACHSGEVDKDDLQLVAANQDNNNEVKYRAAGATSVTLKSGLGTNSSFALMKEMFADMNSGTGANIISSAGGLEMAIEGGQWQNGLFTYCLLEGIQEKTADLDQDGVVTVTELSRYLQERVPQVSGGKQVPTSRAQNLGADFIIR